MLPRTLWARERLLQKQRRGSSSRKGYGTVEKSGDLEIGRDHASSSPAPLDSAGGHWMAFINDERLVSSLTLPGTHDSAAYTIAWPFIQTQNINITQQLSAGIRYFDLRCGLRNNVVEMVHGPSFLGVTLKDVLEMMYDWLESHQSEGLVVQIKEDRKPEHSDVSFAQAIWKVISLSPDYWRTANTTPSLGELRGKIQLLRRFRGPSLYAFGVDVTQWPDNPERPFTIYTWHGISITVQDHYSFPDPEPLPKLVQKKGGDVAGLLSRASSDPIACHWYINFTSAYEFNLYYQLPAKSVALGGYSAFRWEDGMNVRLRNYLRVREGRRRFGIVAMDFPESGTDDLITILIQSNFESRPSRNCPISWSTGVLMLVLALYVIIGNAPVWPHRTQHRSTATVHQIESAEGRR